MPWTTADVSSHNKDVPDEHKPTWVKVANDTRARCMKKGGTETMCDALAIATANKAVKKIKEAEVGKETRDMRRPELREVAGMSLNDMQEKLRHAVREKVAAPPNAEGPWIKDIYDDYLIYEYDGKLYQASYTIPAEGDATLGASTEVVEKTSYVPVSKVAEEAADLEDFVPLVEASGDDGVFLAKIISPGWGTSGYYSADVLKRDAGIYKERLPMFWDHPKKGDNPERSLRDMAGKLVEDGHWEDNGPMGPGIYAKAQAYTPYRSAIKEMQADIGLSHRAVGARSLGEAEGKKGPIVEKIVAAHSVDYVTAPGRGGAVTELFESARQKAYEVFEETRGGNAHDINWGEITLEELKRKRPDVVEAMRSELKQAVYDEKKKLKEVELMTEEEIKVLEDAKAQLEADNATLMEEVKRLKEREILAEAAEIVHDIVAKSELPDITKDRLAESLSRNPVLTEDGKLDTELFTENINEAIKVEMEYVAKLRESGKVKGMGTSGTADGKALLKETFKRGYIREGKDEEEAERLATIAADGR